METNPELIGINQRDRKHTQGEILLETLILAKSFLRFRPRGMVVPREQLIHYAVQIVLYSRSRRSLRVLNLICSCCFPNFHAFIA